MRFPEEREVPEWRARRGPRARSRLRRVRGEVTWSDETQGLRVLQLIIIFTSVKMSVTIVVYESSYPNRR